MRILITGSSGQIGTNLALHLMEQGHDVLGIDKRPNAWTSKIPTLVHDLRDPILELPSVGAEAGDIDVVVHLGANAKVHDLVTEPRRALDNITSTFNVLDFCRHHGLPIIFSSSREVYGDIHRYITDEPHANFAFTESPYSASKIAGEALIYSYARCYKLPYIVFRFSNVYGRFDNDLERMERVLPLFISKIANGEPITIYGKDKVLDFTYVDDCVAGISRAIELLAEGSPGRHTINLAYGQGNTLTRAAELIGESLGVTPDIHYDATRPGEVARYIANISYAREILGYDPAVPLDEGIAKAVEWSTSWSAVPVADRD
jgi:nucleoside-diphosphate-sugar epimerase